jgi:hypothetical protein
MHDGYILSDMSKIVILNFLWVYIMYPNVSIEIGLDVIDGDVLVLEIPGSLAQGVRECDIASLVPGSLDLGDLFLVALLFLELAHHIGDVTH